MLILKTVFKNSSLGNQNGLFLGINAKNPFLEYIFKRVVNILLSDPLKKCFIELQQT